MYQVNSYAGLATSPSKRQAGQKTENSKMHFFDKQIILPIFQIGNANERLGGREK